MVGLPDPKLGFRTVKANIDTGTRSSSLHAFDVKNFVRARMTFVRFQVYPLQRDYSKTLECEAEVFEIRMVRISMGHEQERTVTMTTIEILG